ncbi:unnamed protein product [Chrysoparadoxa australica]
MSIVILVVGTRGDCQPFISLGRSLQRDRHRVRLATHACYEEDVKGAGLEFYPLGGDPHRLSRFMVETSGRLLPNLLNKAERESLPEKITMMESIIQSTYPACTACDPKDPEQRAFIADAIISNPVTYAHIHCAEALSAPLHIMFPQPWIPTASFPHPFAGMSYSSGGSRENWLSYHLVDYAMYLGVEPFINDLRVNQMGLDPIRRGDHGYALLNDNHVPFTKMWSPSLAPKAPEWGPHVDVVGNFFEAQGDAPVWEAPEPLLEFLEAGEPPIFIGFGSMVIEDTKSLVDIIAGAVKKAGTRVLIQSSWSELGGDNLPKTIFQLGPAPHAWLLPKMAAVVHHGGAGTCAAGLRAGLPTLICPFFGDQHYWGEMVLRAGCGPKPIPIKDMTVELLSKAFGDLRSEDMRAKASLMKQRFAEEDGVKGGKIAFYKNLPVEDMVCDVSLFCNKPKIARVYCRSCQLKLSADADEIIHGSNADEEMRKHSRQPFRFVNWGAAGPAHILEGALQGVGSVAHEVAGGVADLVRLPISGYKAKGVAGAVKGVGQGLFSLIHRPIRGGVILVDKIAIGAVNMAKERTDSLHVRAEPAVRKSAFYDRFRTWQGAMSPRGAASVTTHNINSRRAEMSEIFPKLVDEVKAGFLMAKKERENFNKLGTVNSRSAVQMVQADVLEQALVQRESELNLSPTSIKELVRLIDTSGDGFISFQEYCMFAKAVHVAEKDGSSDSSCGQAKLKDIVRLCNFNVLATERFSWGGLLMQLSSHKKVVQPRTATAVAAASS